MSEGKHRNMKQTAKLVRIALAGNPNSGKTTVSDRIDFVVTNRVLGLPIFLAMMFLAFKLTFTVGTPFMDWIEDFFDWLSGTITAFWPEGAAPLLQSLAIDGIIGGVGGVIVFLPNILLLSLAIAILEDSGYMARAAFIMDRFMHKIGLSPSQNVKAIPGNGRSSSSAD